MDDVHVVPLNDLREHVDSRWCPCHPSLAAAVEGPGIVVVHNAWDCRELTEQIPTVQLKHFRN